MTELQQRLVWLAMVVMIGAPTGFGVVELPVIPNFLTVLTRPQNPPLDLTYVGLDLEGSNAFKFYVKACRGARMWLHPRSSRPGTFNKNTYKNESVEIVLGESLPFKFSLSYMRRCGYSDRPECHPDVINPVNPLRCGVLKPYWVSWEDSEIRFGRGKTVARNQLMKISNYTQNHFDRLIVTAVTNAYWVFPPTQGNAPLQPVE